MRLVLYIAIAFVTAITRFMPARSFAQGDQIAGLTTNPQHQAAIAGGLAHFASLPLIELNGDEAFVTSYVQVIFMDKDGTPL